ncbi:MAG: hypothetical protein QME66_07520 [Candidatus Eisenbacteria bacterium]|nr:hypothetical protein [Candidatus Eisenbacteria bacterium]
MSNRPKRLVQLFAAIAVGLLSVTNAQAVPITFQVNMSYQIQRDKFDPANEFVDVAGSFNNWGSPLAILSDSNADETYGITIDGFVPGTDIEYKFRINGV